MDFSGSRSIFASIVFTGPNLISGPEKVFGTYLLLNSWMNAIKVGQTQVPASLPHAKVACRHQDKETARRSPCGLSLGYPHFRLPLGEDSAARIPDQPALLRRDPLLEVGEQQVTHPGPLPTLRQMPSQVRFHPAQLPRSSEG